MKSTTFGEFVIILLVFGLVRMPFLIIILNWYDAQCDLQWYTVLPYVSYLFWTCLVFIDITDDLKK